MPAAFLTRLRRRRRPIVLIAACLVALQTLLAGLAAAQAAVLAANPFDAGVICHGTGGADSPDGTTPDTGQHGQACCAFCTAAAPAMLPLNAPTLARINLGPDAGEPGVPLPCVPIAARAVRDGFSQPPPSLA